MDKTSRILDTMRRKTAQVSLKIFPFLTNAEEIKLRKNSKKQKVNVRSIFTDTRRVAKSCRKECNRLHIPLWKLLKNNCFKTLTKRIEHYAKEYKCITPVKLLVIEVIDTLRSSVIVNNKEIKKEKKTTRRKGEKNNRKNNKSKNSKTFVAKKKPYTYLRDPLWLDTIRPRILYRDNNSCRVCGGKDILQVHHRSYNKEVMRGEDDGKLITLCRNHHMEIHFIEFYKKDDLRNIRRHLTDVDNVLLELLSNTK